MSAPAPRVGDVIAGKYRIEKPLGEGGMAVVFAASHLGLGRSVALKFVRPWALGEDEARQRFMREAQATFSLRSEHAVRMLDLGELPGGDLFLVMELLEGQTFSDVIQQRAPIPEAEAARFIRQACDAIGEAHALGIIHRDLKPANLFLTTTHTGKCSVKVLDFGLAKITGTVGPGSVSPLTGIATTLGTPKYMAPEQWERSTRVDGRADIYSLGVILFQLLTGKVPHEDLPLDERLRMILAGAVPSPRGLRPEISEAMARVVMRCLRPLPDERFATAQQLAEALAHAESAAMGDIRPGPAVFNVTGVTAVVPDAVRRAVQREVDVKQGFGSAAAVSVSPNNLAAAPVIEQSANPQTDRMEKPTVMQPAFAAPRSAPSTQAMPGAPSMSGPPSQAGGDLSRTLLSGGQPAPTPAGGWAPVPTAPTAVAATQNVAAYGPPMSPGRTSAYAPPATPPIAWQPPQKKGSGAVVAIVLLAGLTVIGAVGGAAFLFFRNGPPEVSAASTASTGSEVASSAAPILAPSAATAEPVPALTQVAKKKIPAVAPSRALAGAATDAGVAVTATAPVEDPFKDPLARAANPEALKAATADAGATASPAAPPPAAAPATTTSTPVVPATPAAPPPTKKKNGKPESLGF